MIELAGLRDIFEESCEFDFRGVDGVDHGTDMRVLNKKLTWLAHVIECIQDIQLRQTIAQAINHI